MRAERQFWKHLQPASNGRGFPFACAFLRPALTRSRIKARSNSAIAPMIWNMIFKSEVPIARGHCVSPNRQLALHPPWVVAAERCGRSRSIRSTFGNFCLRRSIPVLHRQVIPITDLQPGRFLVVADVPPVPVFRNNPSSSRSQARTNMISPRLWH